MIPTLNESCCTLSLRTGSIVIAVAFAIFMLLNAAHYHGILDSSEDKVTDKEGGRLARTSGLVVIVFMLVVCAIIVVGVFMRMSILLLIGAVVFFIFAVIVIVVGPVVLIDTGDLLQCIANMLTGLLMLYSSVVLWSHGKELE